MALVIVHNHCLLQLEEPLLDKAQNKMDELERSILQMEASTNNHTTTHPLATSHSPDGLTILMGNILGGGTSTAPVSRTTCVAGAPVIVDPPALLGGKVEGDGCSSVTVRPAVDLSFIRDAVKELLKCRRVLKATYCYGYYITGLVSKKQFEHMQVSSSECRGLHKHWCVGGSILLQSVF